MRNGVSSCAIAELADIAEQEGRDRAAYWHEQDEEYFREGHALHVRYCHFPKTKGEEDSEAVEVEIGSRVVDALSTAGLTMDWNGNPSTAIQVTGIAKGEE